MYTRDEVKEICAEMAEDLKIEHGDLVLADDGLSAEIPYYSHGRMNSHVIDLAMMAKSALIIARRPTPHSCKGD